MSAELLLNVMWAAWVWLTAVAAAVWLARYKAAALRRQLCRLGLMGVPLAMLGAGLLHASRPDKGLWVRRADAAPAGVSIAQRPPPAPEAAEEAPMPLQRLSDAASLAGPWPAGLTESVEIAAAPQRPAAHLADADAAASARPDPGPAAGAARRIELPGALDPWRYAACLAGAVSLIMLLALAARQLCLAMWRRTWRPAAPAWQSLTARLARRIGVRRRVRVFTAERLQHPAAAGIIRPAILLPKRYPQPLGPSVRSVLTHELAHLHARDPLWNLLSRAVLAAAWWCPLTWWLHRRARIESELTADDHVLAAGTAATSLAETLARLAESTPPAHAPVLSGMACHLTRRIKMMLDERIPHHPRRPLRSRLAVLAGACLLAAAVVCVPLVGVARAEDDERPAVRPARIARPTGLRRGRVPATRPIVEADSVRAHWPRTADKELTLRIRIQDGRLVVESAEGNKLLAAKEIRLTGSGASGLRVQAARDDTVTIAWSAPPARTEKQPLPQLVKVYQLKYAPARDVAAKVEEVYRFTPERLSTVADRRGNRILVRGSPEDLQAFEALLAQLDTPAAGDGPPGSPPEVRVYKLQHARAADMGRIVASIVEATASDLKVTPDPRSNALVAAGRPHELALLEALLKELDRPADQPPAPAEARRTADMTKRPLTGPQLGVLIGQAERLLFDLEGQVQVAELRVLAANEAHKKGAATPEEVKEKEIVLRVAHRKLKSVQKELEELRRLLAETRPGRYAPRPAGRSGPAPPTRAPTTPRRR